jgi:serine/threonine-protein kinase
MQNTLEAPAASDDVRPGLVLGRYELLVPIAAGGMAQVWAARLRGARQFQKLVAVKTMLPKLSEDEQFEQMFLDEASLASQVRHPNAVEIMDLGEHAGVLYLVMEWIEGVPLNQLMKSAKSFGGLPPKIAARIALQACAGLHAAHELKDEKGQLVGLVHRDVSPQNLLVTYDGVTKVVDFGVAKATALGGGATVAGQVKGKVSYMAPEQINGEGLDRRADVFAMGIILYALTTGKHPFRRESEAATMYNICSPEPVVPPSKVVDKYPPELEPIVLRALEKKRANRFASCDEMLRALDGLPSDLRVSSDADVASFVQQILGEKRAEQRRRIEEAIIRADTAVESGVWTGTDSTSGVTGRSASTGSGSFEITGVPAGLHRQVVRNRILGVIGLLALAIGGSVLTTMALQTPEPPAELRVLEAPEPPAPGDFIPGAPGAGPSELEATEDGEGADASNSEGSDATDSSEELADGSSSSKKKSKNVAVGSKRKPAPSGTKASSPKTTPSPGRSEDWRLESGL